MPVTVPDVKPTVAIAVLLLVHVPPLIPFDSDEVVPTHKLVDPLMSVGAGVTVIVVVV